MVTLETERIVLRDFVSSDWEAINAILSDPDVTRHMHFSTWTHQQRREWFDWCIENNHEPNRDVYNWGITLKESATLIGWFGIGSSSRATIEGERGFGYLLHRHFWSQGYMTEVLRAIMGFEFETLRTRRLSATCETDNHASARVMEKAGMRHERTVRDTDFEGNWADRHHYVMDKQDYEHHE